MAVFLNPNLVKIFRGFIAAGSFPVQWGTAKKTPIPKGSSISIPFRL